MADAMIGCGTAVALVLHLKSMPNKREAGYDWCFNFTIGIAIKYVVTIALAMIHAVLRDTEDERRTTPCRGIVLGIDVGGGLFLVLVQILTANRDNTLCGSTASRSLQTVWLIIVSIRSLVMMISIARRERERSLRDSLWAAAGGDPARPNRRQTLGLTAAELDSVPNSVHGIEDPTTSAVVDTGKYAQIVLHHKLVELQNEREKQLHHPHAMVGGDGNPTLSPSLGSSSLALVVHTPSVGSTVSCAFASPQPPIPPHGVTPVNSPLPPLPPLQPRQPLAAVIELPAPAALVAPPLAVPHAHGHSPQPAAAGRGVSPPPPPPPSPAPVVVSHLLQPPIGFAFAGPIQPAPLPSAQPLIRRHTVNDRLDCKHFPPKSRTAAPASLQQLPQFPLPVLGSHESSSVPALADRWMRSVARLHETTRSASARHRPLLSAVSAGADERDLKLRSNSQARSAGQRHAHNEMAGFQSPPAHRPPVHPQMMRANSAQSYHHSLAGPAPVPATNPLHHGRSGDCVLPADATRAPANAIAHLSSIVIREFRFTPVAPVPGDDSAGPVCSVCLESIEDGHVIKTMPKCTHKFHVACITEWLKTRNSCPNCRSAVISR